jgi:hypothetical protein
MPASGFIKIYYGDRCEKTPKFYKNTLDSQKLFGIVMVQVLDITVCKCLGEISSLQTI